MNQPITCERCGRTTLDPDLWDPEIDTGRVFCDTCWDHRDEPIDRGRHVIALERLSTETWAIKIGTVDFRLRRRKSPEWMTHIAYAWRLVAIVDGVWISTQWFDTKADACRWLEDNANAHA